MSGSKELLEGLKGVPNLFFGKRLKLDGLPVISSSKVAQFVTRYKEADGSVERYHLFYDYFDF